MKNLTVITSKSSDGNMSFRYEDLEKVFKNRNAFFKKNKINPKKIVFSLITHNNLPIIVDKKDCGRKIKTDCLITFEKNILLFLLTADCLPVILYGSKEKALALIHVSRKNINSIIKNTAKILKNKGVDVKKLQVFIGPSIGPCHYETDLWQIAKDKFISEGLLRKNIKNKKICTFESKNYFSHRKSLKTGEIEGRFVTLTGMI